MPRSFIARRNFSFWICDRCKMAEVWGNSATLISEPFTKTLREWDFLLKNRVAVEIRQRLGLSYDNIARFSHPSLKFPDIHISIRIDRLSELNLPSFRIIRAYFNLFVMDVFPVHTMFISYAFPHKSSSASDKFACPHNSAR